MTLASSLKKGEIFSHNGAIYTVVTPGEETLVVDKYMHKINGRWKFNMSKDRRKMPAVAEVQRVRIKLENY